MKALLPLLALALLGASPAPPSVCAPGKLVAMVGRAREAGYRDGYRRGQAEAPPQRDPRAGYLWGEELKARKYAACIGELRVALTQGDYALRATAGRCVDMLPFGG